MFKPSDVNSEFVSDCMSVLVPPVLLELVPLVVEEFVED